MGASIEAPFALLEKPVEVLLPDPVEAAQVTFGLVPEVLDPVDVASAPGEESGVVDPVVMKARDIQSVVGAEGVGEDDAVGADLLLDDRQKRLGPGVGNDGRVDLSTPFEKAEDGDLARSTASTLPFPDPAEVALISLDLAGEFEARLLAGDQLAKPHEERDGGVGLDTRQLGCGTCRRARHKVLDQTPLHPRAQSASPLIHRSFHRPVSGP